MMNIDVDWEKIRKHFNRCFKTNFHVSIASVGSDNYPTVTPIGSLFLNNDLTGFYFEKYPSKLPKHQQDNHNICILAVNSATWFWLKSLFIGKFATFPAIKLYGELGILRKASAKEINRLNRRMKVSKGMKGNTYLWGDMSKVREIRFTKAEKINLAAMTADL